MCLVLFYSIAGDVVGSDLKVAVGRAVNIETTSPSAIQKNYSIGRCAPVMTGTRIPPVVGQRWRNEDYG